MIRLTHVRNYDDKGPTSSRFDTIPERDRRTNGRTDRITIAIWRDSIAVLTRDKDRRTVSDE